MSVSGNRGLSLNSAGDEILNGFSFRLFSVLESVTQIPDGHDSTATSKESLQPTSAATSPNDTGGGASVGSPGTESFSIVLLRFEFE